MDNECVGIVWESRMSVTKGVASEIALRMSVRGRLCDLRWCVSERELQ